MESLKQYCNFEEIPLKDDYEGKVIATFISSKNNVGNRPSILYVHGFVDFFFHIHLMDAFNEKGYDFYALDLRKYGHSLLSHQHPNYCKNIEEYFEELDISINKVKALSGNHKLMLIAHSTGGLTTSLYLNKGKEKDKVNGLMLNSPFLDLNLPKKQKKFVRVVAKILPAMLPYAVVLRDLPKAYGRSLHKDHDGEWDYNLAYKPLNGFPTFFAWIGAVVKAQKYIQSKSTIQQPVFLMHSKRSLEQGFSKEDFDKSDIVLNVNHMRKYGPTLGKDVVLLELDGALHDVFLSKQPIREKAMQEMFRWLESKQLYQ